MDSLLSVLSLPEDIKKVFSYLQSLLEEKGLYDSSLDLQIMNLSSQIIQYNKVIAAFISGPTTFVKGQDEIRKNPLMTDSVLLSNSIRNNLKSLGLTLGEKVSGVTKNNPLGNLINKLNEIDEEDEIEDDEEEIVEEENKD